MKTKGSWMTFGQKMRSLHLSHKMTQRELAEYLDVDFTYLSKLENGKMHRPSENFIVRLANGLNADADELLILAGRIPSDIYDIIIANPHLIPELRSRCLNPYKIQPGKPCHGDIDMTAEQMKYEANVVLTALTEEAIDILKALSFEEMFQLAEGLSKVAMLVNSADDKTDELHILYGADAILTLAEGIVSLRPLVLPEWWRVSQSREERSAILEAQQNDVPFQCADSYIMRMMLSLAREAIEAELFKSMKKQVSAALQQIFNERANSGYFANEDVLKLYADKLTD